MNGTWCPYCMDFIFGPSEHPEFGQIYKCSTCGAIGKECSKCGTIYFAKKEEVDEIKGRKYSCPKCGNPIMLGKNKKTSGSGLKEFGRDLTEEVKKEEIVVFGRDEEINKIIEILVREEKNNPLLVGEAGVGKTTIVKGLSKRIVEKKVPPKLFNKRVIEIRVSDLVSGTRYRGDFEERVKNILDEIKKHPEIIVFIDEIHTIVGAGAGSSESLDFSNILKPALVSGEFCCIGATTFDEYQLYIAKDKALSRRFNPVFVKELSPDATIELLKHIKTKFEKAHNVSVSNEAIKLIVELSEKYLINRRFPDKAIDVLDISCAKASMRRKSNIDVQIIQQTVGELANVPVQILESEREKFSKCEEFFKPYIFGQDEAIKEVSSVLREIGAGLKDPNKPVTFLFLGPTGVGKTEMAKLIASFLFGSKDKMIRIDMSEYREEHSVSNLKGAPPGYIGYEREGQLSGQLKKSPFSVVLLDEFEKAHPAIFNFFLSVFDDGHFIDSKGERVDARHAVFIMTSNLKKEELELYFRPEFLNRIDKIIVFKPLELESIRKIVDKLTEEFNRERLKTKKIKITLDESVKEILCTKGFNPEMGARELKRTFERLIVEPLSYKILNNEILPGSLVKVSAINGEIKFEIEKQNEVILEVKEKEEKLEKEIDKLEKEKKEILQPFEIKEHIIELLKSYKEDLKEKGINLKIDKKIIDYLVERIPFSPTISEVENLVDNHIKNYLEKRIKEGKVKKGDEIKVIIKNNNIVFEKKVKSR